MSEKFFLRFAPYAPVAIRASLSVVFFLFGLQKLTNPGQATAEIQLLLNFGLADSAALNYYLGLMEMTVALALLFGVYIRIMSVVAIAMVSSFLLSFFFKYGISINPNLYRDVGLIGAALALFLLGAGPLSFDAWRAKRLPKKDQESD